MPQRRIPGRAIIARSVAKAGVQNMKIEQIRETAQKKLFVGKKVKVLEFGKDRHGTNVLRKKKNRNGNRVVSIHLHRHFCRRIHREFPLQSVL